MTDTALSLPSQPSNPLELLEDVALANEWPYDRPGEDELMITLAGNWSDYRIGFIWQAESSSLQCYARLDLTVGLTAESALAELLMAVNERMSLGHFIFDSLDRRPLFRYTLLLRGMPSMALEQVEDVIETMMGECERFWPAFEFLIRDGRPARAAMEQAILETHGEA